MADQRILIAALAGLAGYAFWRSRQPSIMTAPGPTVAEQLAARYASSSAVTVDPSQSRPSQPTAPVGRCPRTDADIRADVREFVARNPTWLMDIGKAAAYLKSMPIPCMTPAIAEMLKIAPASQSRILLIQQTARAA